MPLQPQVYVGDAIGVGICACIIAFGLGAIFGSWRTWKAANKILDRK